MKKIIVSLLVVVLLVSIIPSFAADNKHQATRQQQHQQFQGQGKCLDELVEKGHISAKEAEEIKEARENGLCPGIELNCHRLREGSEGQGQGGQRKRLKDGSCSNRN